MRKEKTERICKFAKEFSHISLVEFIAFCFIYKAHKLDKTKQRKKNYIEVDKLKKNPRQLKAEKPKAKPREKRKVLLTNFKQNILEIII
jgi:hypothetical protein